MALYFFLFLTAPLSLANQEESVNLAIPRQGRGESSEARSGYGHSRHHRHGQTHARHGNHIDLTSLDIGSCDWDTSVEFDYRRHDIGNVSAPTSLGGPGLCCGHCDRTPRCTHWVWAAGYCWLKSNERGPTPSTITPCGRKGFSTRDVWPASWSTTCAYGLASRLSSSSALASERTINAATIAETSHGTEHSLNRSIEFDGQVTKYDGPKLFCFVLVRPTENEHALLRHQLRLLKQCDGFAVYSNTSEEIFGDLPFPGNQRIEVPSGLKERSMDVPYGPFLNALNTPTFLPVFRHVFDIIAATNAGKSGFISRLRSKLFNANSSYDGSSRSLLTFDWVIKIDVDTVVAIDRLRRVLRDYDPTVPQVLCNKPLWLGPIEFGHPTCLDGPVEVVSAAGAELYATKAATKCEARVTNSKFPFIENGGHVLTQANSSSMALLTLPQLSFDVGRMGEDWFLDTCFAEALLPKQQKRKYAARVPIEHRKRSVVIEPRLLVNSYPQWPLDADATEQQHREWDQNNVELQRRQSIRNKVWCKGPHNRGSKAALHPVKDPKEFARCLEMVLSVESL